ncbi:MAG: beta-mannosidase [Bacteroidetes bacterium]|nr:beta-mannosidase [Bacteroidota bacterium]
MKSKTFFNLILLLLCGTALFSGPSKISYSLSGGWRIHTLNDTTSYKAKVPGTVHMDLFRSGVIGDPFYRSNEDSIQWVADEDWVYELEFEMKAENRKKNMSLVFEGLDTHAIVYLNDSLILEANNMFRSWEIDVINLLKLNNNLKVVFKSPHKYNKEKEEELGYKLPEERVFSRKAPYQFGWDWGPEFVTMGIWKEVYLKVWDDYHLEDVYYRTDSIRNDKAYITAALEIWATVEKELDLKILAEGDQYIDQKLSIHTGKNFLHVPIIINEPKLWWTNGLGEPHCYTFYLRLEDDKDFLVDLKSIGIRTLELVQNVDEHGKSFYFELNGEPLFIKGANYIPQDNFLSRHDIFDFENPFIIRNRYTNIIQSAAEANMNMLRVWGGGIYEIDGFYGLCEESGILVWQDFMFACAMYPGDEDFLENVKQEAIQNVKRLRQHPSIALWCGNNEVDEAWHNWGWQKQFNYTQEQQDEIWKSYTDLFHEILPDVVSEYDPQRAYWASSPSIGWGHPESLTQGDSHYWGVWWGAQPFEIYEEKVGRFMSEYGFQGFPAMATLDSVLLEEDKYLASPALKTHQKHPRGFELIQEYMERDFPVPADFEDYAYVSQLLQAHGITMAIEAHRRAMPYCMGTLYWQLNDCWPVISWSGIDYYGNWKALHYHVKKAYDKIILSTEEIDEQLKIYAVSDDLLSHQAKLNIKLMDFEGNLLKEHNKDVKVESNTSRIIHTLNINELLGNHKKRNVFLQMELSIYDSTTVSKNVFFSKPKELKLPADYQLQTRFEKKEYGYDLILQSDKLIKGLFINIPSEKVFISDNYFDILPNMPIRISLVSYCDIQNIEEKVEFKSLNKLNSGRKN